MLNSEVSQLSIKDFDLVQDYCLKMTEALVDGIPGVEDKDVDRLKNIKHDFKLAIDFQNGKKDLSKEKLKYIEERGLKNILKIQAEVGVELTEALLSTSEMINQTDPAALRDGVFQGDSYVDICAEANSQFTDFFIKVQKKMSLTNENVLCLFDKMFTKVGFDRELKAKALGKFPGGVISALRTYLKLKDELPGWEIGVSSLTEDKHCGVDLVTTSPEGKEIRLYGVKGSISFPEVRIDEVTEKNQMEVIKERIKNCRLDDGIKMCHLSALNRIYEYAAKYKKDGDLKIRAFWVEAPSNF